MRPRIEYMYPEVNLFVFEYFGFPPFGSAVVNFYASEMIVSRHVIGQVKNCKLQFGEALSRANERFSKDISRYY